MSYVQIVGDPAARFYLPYLPSINTLLLMKSGGGGKGGERSSYIASLRQEGKVEGLTFMNSLKGRILGPSLVYFGVWRPDRLRRDVHNLFVKPFLDGLVDSGLWHDDSDAYVVSVVVDYLGVRPHNGGVLVEVYEIDSALLTARGLPPYTGAVE